MSEETPFAPPEQESKQQPKPTQGQGSFWGGMVLGFGAHSLQLLTLLVTDFEFMYLYFGLIQFAYQIPLSVFLYFKGLKRMNTGLWAAVGISFLLYIGWCASIIHSILTVHSSGPVKVGTE